MNGGISLNLGAGRAPLHGWVNVDKHGGPGIDLVLDLNDIPWPFADAVVTQIRAHHILEHLRELEAAMIEIHRVCRGKAFVDIVVPYANTLWDCANPEHRSRFNHLTFAYFTPHFDTSDLGLFTGFEIVKQELERELDHEWCGIRWTVANLHTILRVLK